MAPVALIEVVAPVAPGEVVAPVAVVAPKCPATPVAVAASDEIGEPAGAVTSSETGGPARAVALSAVPESEVGAEERASGFPQLAQNVSVARAVVPQRGQFIETTANYPAKPGEAQHGRRSGNGSTLFRRSDFLDGTQALDYLTALGVGQRRSAGSSC